MRWTKLNLGLAIVAVIVVGLLVWKTTTRSDYEDYDYEKGDWYCPDGYRWSGSKKSGRECVRDEDNGERSYTSVRSKTKVYKNADKWQKNWEKRMKKQNQTEDKYNQCVDKCKKKYY